MSWERHERRAAVIDAALHEVAESGATIFGGRVADKIEQEFGDLGGLLQAVAGRWFAAFGARLDDALESHAAEAAVGQAWSRLVTEQPVMYSLLRAHAAHPALAAAVSRQQRFLRSVTGSDVMLPGFDVAPEDAEPAMGRDARPARWWRFTLPARCFTRGASFAKGISVADGMNVSR